MLVDAALVAEIVERFESLRPLQGSAVIFTEETHHDAALRLRASTAAGTSILVEGQAAIELDSMIRELSAWSSANAALSVAAARGDVPAARELLRKYTQRKPDFTEALRKAALCKESDVRHLIC